MGERMTTTLFCPHDECKFTTEDRTRGGDSTMGRHIQSAHATRRWADGCRSCAKNPKEGPNHDAYYRCESGWYSHCSCETCF